MIAVRLTVLAVLLLAACALFSPDQREDVASLVEAQRIEWIDAHKRGHVTTEELNDALARLDGISRKLEQDGTADAWLDLLLAFGGGALTGKGAGPAVRGARNVIATIRRRREPPVKGKG